jgi:2-keto-4-pentenoate hydratase/2-oxohepta-3-ene-1,7-dioic acid hydratase in catechol pathway
MLISRACIRGHIAYGQIINDRFHIVKGNVFERIIRTEAAEPLNNVHLLAPTEPRNVFVVLGGFLPSDGTPLPPGTVPNFTPKITSYVTGQDAVVSYPSSLAGPLVVEVELAAVIGREICNADPEQARDAIFGFTCFNDVSASEFIANRDWLRAKSFETFASMGPWIQTDITEGDIARGLQLTTRVNGQRIQEGNTRDFRFSPSVTIGALSKHVTLYPGDIVSLGTPPPPAEVSPGDTVELEVEGVGVLRNHINRTLT